MRINRLSLSWFRGASESVLLDCRSKSVVVYGANGAGKSSFADAIEYMAGGGRIGHLSHEYSGSKQEKGTRNTHAPLGTDSRLSIELEGGESLDASISDCGVMMLEESSEGLAAEVQGWDLKRLVLRQDELAKFISATKGEKYSALLPLIGLTDFEVAAENLRKLGAAVEKKSGIQAMRQRALDLRAMAMGHLTDVSLEAAKCALDPLVARYVEGEPPSDFERLIEITDCAIGERIASAEPEQRRHIALQEIVAEAIDEKLVAARTADRRAAALAIGLDQQIAVLEETFNYVEAVQGAPPTVPCPACGRSIPMEKLKAHVDLELAELEQARKVRDEALRARSALSASISRMLKIAGTSAVRDWLTLPRQRDLSDAIRQLDESHLPVASEVWGGRTYSQLSRLFNTIRSGLARATRRAPPSTRQLVEDKATLSASRSIPTILELTMQIGAIESTLSVLNGAECSVKETASRLTAAVLADMSDDIQRLWRELHPDEPIEAVRLCVPEDGDRAVDVALSFFGVDQPSPRLTLSEGHRNSLGLCIFLAFVLQEESTGHPVILDDVVSSFDREHRGMMANLIVRELADRQVVILTHDREWYSELRWRLPESEWAFRCLRPWESPATGIQWAQSIYGLDDARALAVTNPEAAGNRARAIMDMELAIVAEKLRIPVGYLRGDRNDRRTCIEFIELIIAGARRSLRSREGDTYVAFPNPIPIWEGARTLLGAWSNRASHTGTLTEREAHSLIDACETALGQFRCGKCGEPIWIADQEKRERVQCACGTVCWQYG